MIGYGLGGARSPPQTPEIAKARNGKGQKWQRVAYATLAPVSCLQHSYQILPSSPLCRSGMTVRPVASRVGETQSVSTIDLALTRAFAGQCYLSQGTVLDRPQGTAKLGARSGFLHA